MGDCSEFSWFLLDLWYFLLEGGGGVGVVGYAAFVGGDSGCCAGHFCWMAVLFGWQLVNLAGCGQSCGLSLFFF